MTHEISISLLFLLAGTIVEVICLWIVMLILCRILGSKKGRE